ncbi:hypothetical protein AVEN_115525-1 [Araneus ventricosus]|uniref:Uncharacterized protein n=1 Tax=Araneus ventricosus TaxID=182803 RepID=A0A4Y2CIG7_ARAVE|nr:hypothetical protein AVEN_115525-1 [Araneus ventricosus]
MPQSRFGSSSLYDHVQVKSNQGQSVFGLGWYGILDYETLANSILIICQFFRITTIVPNNQQCCVSKRGSNRTNQSIKTLLTHEGFSVLMESMLGFIGARAVYDQTAPNIQ